MNTQGVMVAREYCALGCQFASNAGIRMKREDQGGNTRFLVRFRHGGVQAGEWRPDPRHALVAACKLLPF